MQQTINFPSGTVNYLFHSSFDDIWTMCDKQHAVIITNEHIAHLYKDIFKGLKILVIPPSESTKVLETIQSLSKQLLEMEATRKTVLIGVGGGVITDITGFLASVYMRGVAFGFVPTSLLGMVDAAVGGKNGVNLGMNKNILGTVTQPKFIVYDTNFLNTLPDDEWSNGFAEIIKYACIFDSEMFDQLTKNSISYYKNEDDNALCELIEKCVTWKNKTVLEDEHDSGIRKLLNFGHTAAHAIENLYELPHGKAVGIGMIIACMISVDVAGLDRGVVEKLTTLLDQYHLPVRLKIDAHKAMEVLRMDKKRQDADMIDYIVLQKIGQATIQALPLATIEKALIAYESHS